MLLSKYLAKDRLVSQMCCCAFVIYFITLLLNTLPSDVHSVKGPRFGNTIVLIFGAIFSRSVVGGISLYT